MSYQEHCNKCNRRLFSISVKDPERLEELIEQTKRIIKNNCELCKE